VTDQEAEMRQKTRLSTRGRRRTERPPGAAGQDPAEWVLMNETGWGMPHSGIAWIAGLLVLAKAAGWYLGRRAARPPREDRPPR
jgi:hypothetical protein